jgi:hypothetical protein
MRNVGQLAPFAKRTRRWRARWAPGLIAAALAVPGAAHPYSLDALLHMPLERLLQLQIAPRRAVLVTVPDASMAQESWAGRGRHEA